jgi:hypothetical protein
VTEKKTWYFIDDMVKKERVIAPFRSFTEIQLACFLRITFVRILSGCFFGVLLTQNYV